jgi:hypothetical protein
MGNDEFKRKLFEIIDVILNSDIKKELLFRIIKPVIKPAKMCLGDWLDKNPDEVVKYLKIAREKIDEAVTIYENKS